MFDIGWDEMALIAVVSLIVIGPKDLPVVLRQMGRWTRRARDMAAEFQRGLDDIAHESELDDLKRKMAEATRPGGIAQQIEHTIDPDGALGRAMTLPPLEEGASVPVVETPPAAIPPETPPDRPPAP